MADPREVDKVRVNYQEVLRAKGNLLLLASSLLPDLGAECIETLIHGDAFCGDMDIPPVGTLETQRMLVELSGGKFGGGYEDSHKGTIRWSHDVRGWDWVDKEAQEKAREEMRRKHFGEFLDVCDSQMWLLARKTIRLVGQFGKKHPETEENNMKKVFGQDITHYFGKMYGFTIPMWEKAIDEDEVIGEVFMTHLVSDRNIQRQKTGSTKIEGTARYFDHTVEQYETLKAIRNTDYEQTIAQALQAITKI